MATAVQSTPFLFPPSTRHTQTQGILLQHHQPCSPKNPISMGGHRRIRFAPLPDPRRSVLITDDGNELPFPQPTFATQFPAPPTPSPTVDPRNDYFAIFDSASVCSSSSESKPNSDSLEPSSSSSASSTPGTATPVSITTTTPSEYDNNGSVPPSPVSCPPSPLAAVSSKLSAVSASTSSSKSRSFSFLRSFKRSSVSSSSSSSNTLTPVASIDRTQTPTSFSRRNFSAEEILTLGTINLFRASSSRDCSDNETSSGWSLARWSSAGSHSHHHKEPNWGSPLARVSSTQSTQSYQSKSKSKFNAPKNVRPSGLRPNRKGTRMLNGRVYGVKRPQNANPFANARDEEPEFVEWGYGGMGSVKGATSAGAHGRWGRLHGQSVTTATAANKSEDEDDGSGMAWIKKRREQREREKREREEGEKKDKQSKAEKEEVVAEETVVETPPTVEKKDLPTLSRPGTASSAKTVSAASAASSCTITPCASSVSTPLANVPAMTSPPAPSGASALSAVTTPIEEEHVTRAVNVPAPHHYLHRGHSRSSSKDVKDVSTAESKLVVVEDKIESESRSSTSESDSESDGEREDEEDDDDDDDEVEEEEEERKTALGAGVEKISRHH